MTTVRVVCPDCGFWIEVSYRETPPAALTSTCGNCGAQMTPREKVA